MLTMGVLGTLFDIFTGQALWKGIWAIIDALFLVIDSMVYAVINYTYSIFTLLAGARVLDANTLTDMANRVYIFIGVVALFLVAYALLTAIIDPDKASKGDNSLGKVIPNVALAIVGIAIVPTVFTYAYRVQKAILCENIIPKWLIEENYENIDSTNENAGATLATELFQSFFIPKDSNMDGYQAAVNSAREGDSFISAFGPLLGDVVDGNITYLIIISTVAGLFCAYVLLGYCLDAGLRAVKLAYLQLLAPLPILLTIIPGQKKVFKNWLSKTVSCFLEVFVRIFAMAFVIYIINHLPNLLENNQLFEGACATQPGIITVLLIKAIIICALFDFMKQAPKLISEITGIDSKGFSIGLKGRGVLGDALSTLGGTATAAAGAGYFARRNGQDVVAAMKYGAAKNLKGKGKGNQFGSSARDYYKNILKRDNEPSLLTGKQKAYDQSLDAYRKSAQNSYVDYKKKKYEQDSTFKGFVNDAIKETQNSRQADYLAAKKNYNDVISKRDALVQQANNEAATNDAKVSNLENELANFRNSKEYLQNLSAGRSKIENYEQQINEAKKLATDSRRKVDVAQHSYDSEIENAKKSVQDAYAAYNISPDEYKRLAAVQARAKYAALTEDEIKTLSNGDPYMGEIIKQTQDDINFVIKIENEKAAKDYANSLEGQKLQQNLNAFIKQTGIGSPVPTGQFGGGSQSNGSDKKGDSK